MEGSTGIAFEYAIHDAVRTRNPIVQERVADALKECRITRGDPASILFAIEKQGSQQLLNTDFDLVTEDSRWLSGKVGQPPKLKNYMNRLAAAFRRPSTRPNLPQSIRGLWKADLFLGSSEPDHWVGTTVKYNPSRLEAASGLRVAIVPTQSGQSDAIRFDEAKNLVVCPVPHDASFMQAFHEGWRIAQALCERTSRCRRTWTSPILCTGKRRAYSLNAVISRSARSWRRPRSSRSRTCSRPRRRTSTQRHSKTSDEPDTRTVVGPFPLQT